MSTHRFALTLARCSGAADALWACPRPSNRFASFDCALRFAPCARHFSPSGLRRPATGTRMHFCVSHRPSIQHGRSAPSHRAALAARCSVAAHCASLRVLAISPSGLRTPLQARLWPSLLHWSLRTGLRFVGPVFRLRSASALSSPLHPFRGFDDYGLFPPLAAAFVRFLNSQWSSCCAWRLAILPCSLGLLRPVSATGGGLRALPQFSMVVLLRLAACNTPLLIGLTTACFRHWRRPSCAPRNMPKKRAKKASGAGGFSPGHLL